MKNDFARNDFMDKKLYFNVFCGPQHTKRKYSNKLMWELKDFFAKHDEGYYDESEKRKRFYASILD